MKYLGEKLSTINCVAGDVFASICNNNFRIRSMAKYVDLASRYFEGVETLLENQEGTPE